MEIPSQYNPKEVEDKIYKKWIEAGYFNAETDPQKKPFTIVIPPPNVTGILHMGHALNNTIQDVLIRFKRMQGYASLWMPGTDHAGIATQNVVERDLAKEGLKKEDLGREKFIERLWGWTNKHGSAIIEQLKKLGASCDFRRTRFTLDENYSEAVKEVFIQLYDKGLIYRGNYIINWCPRCKTALSDEEAHHREVDGWLYYIRYPIKQTKDVKDVDSGTSTKDYIVVATTRPETMLGDTAIAVNPKDDRYTWLKKEKVILPIMDRELSVIEDELVDPGFGTGVVKVTPAHDPTDFLFAQRYGLQFINIMKEDAVLNENAGEFSGMDRFEAREAVIEVLAEKKLLEKKEAYKISAGHCYRCHTIIEPRLSLQWFVKMKPLAESAVAAVEEDKVIFHPARWKKAYLNWMYNIKDWCISRQIWWGHRIPVYYCKNCQKSKIENEVIVSRNEPDVCPVCGGTDIYQDNDVLDTWFSSWLWPFAAFYWPFSKTKDEGLSGVSAGVPAFRRERMKDDKDLNYFYPTSTLVTAPEILFFWVARMIMSGLEFIGNIPFRDVVIHGTVRDERGIKMSKSLGNSIDPLTIIDKFGADSLRFSLMLLSASGSDVHLSDEKFLVGRNFSNKIWNATRFILLKIKEKEYVVNNLELEISKLDIIDKWVLVKLNQLTEDVTSNIESYVLNEAVKKIQGFFWNVFCDWYIEIAKDNLHEARLKAVLYVLLNTLKLLHPFMPFITEEIFQMIKQTTLLSLEDAIIISVWPVKLYDDEIDKAEVKTAENLLDTVRGIRNIKVNLGIAQKKLNLEVKVRKEYSKLWEESIAWLERLTFSKEIIFKETVTRVLYKNELWEINLSIEEFDVNNFISLLQKKIQNLDIVLGKVSSRLNNEKFLNNADEDIIEEEKNKSNELGGQIRQLKELKDAFS